MSFKDLLQQKKREKREEERIESELEQFRGGTEYYYRFFGGLLYTDGIKYIINNWEALWLIGDIASYQISEDVKNHIDQWWTLEKFDKETEDGYVAKLVGKDFEENILVEQYYHFCDFPLSSFVIRLIDDVIFLPLED